MHSGAVGISYKQHGIGTDDAFDAIVIGSGIGGLGVAALLARVAGKRVLVLERHYTAGGFTHVFSRSGFEWDVGVHYIGQVHDREAPTRKLYDFVTAGRLAWQKMPAVYDRIVVGGDVYDFPAGEEALRLVLQQRFPTESASIDRYFALVRACSQAAGPYFTARALPPALAGILGGPLRTRFLQHARHTTAAVLARCTHHPMLAAVLAGQWANYGSPPGQSSFGPHALIAQHYFDGASYPVGGAAEIARHIAPLIVAAGGRIVVRAEVQSILVEGRRAVGVRLQDGREIRAAVVISDAGARNTYEQLLPATTPGCDAVRRALRALPPSMAHLCLYVGLDRDDRSLGTDAANLWVHAGPDHDANYARFCQDPTAPLPLAFISFPSAKDPDFAARFPGRATIEVVSPAPFAWFAAWSGSRLRHRGPAYEELKARLHERLLNALIAAVPQVKGHIQHVELSTPLSTRHFANVPDGEIYGIAHTPARFQCRALQPRTPVQNLFLTGQDAAVCGVTGALMGAVLTASVLLRRNLLGVIAKSR